MSDLQQHYLDGGLRDGTDSSQVAADVYLTESKGDEENGEPPVTLCLSFNNCGIAVELPTISPKEIIRLGKFLVEVGKEVHGKNVYLKDHKVN